MYTKFFNLNEYPFSTRPDPKYFFPGKCHEEALLHLKYSVSEGEGFTLITGEKGIGKTTLCRAYIECRDEQVVSAFISYSKLNSKILLIKITEEFGIKVKRGTLKDFTDAFNNFLIQKKTEGKRVVVFLDDAHKHDNDVLEQLRLLSNLETVGCLFIKFDRTPFIYARRSLYAALIGSCNRLNVSSHVED